MPDLADFSAADPILVEHVSDRLRNLGLMLATAESCTGGLIAAALTARAGSSEIFERGFVTYSNDSKIELLGVPAGVLRDHGAVSAQVSIAMARGALAHSRADLSLSVTGIAGPGGGSADKPVGTVWVSICRDNFHQARLLNLMVLTDRERIVQGTAQAALNWLRQLLS